MPYASIHLSQSNNSYSDQYKELIKKKEWLKHECWSKPCRRKLTNQQYDQKARIINWAIIAGHSKGTVMFTNA